MSVRINLFHPRVQQYIGNQDVVEVEGTTVGECLSDLIRRFPGVERWIFNERGQLLEHVFVYVNAESATKAKLSETVTDRDELIIAVLLAGG